MDIGFALPIQRGAISVVQGTILISRTVKQENVEQLKPKSKRKLQPCQIATINTDPKPVLYHYVILRRDLPLGTMIAQTVHAAGESSPGNIPSDTHAVALAARDESELMQIESCLLLADIRHKAIREDDEPYCAQLMCIGLEPCYKTAEIKAILGRLPLIK